MLITALLCKVVNECAVKSVTSKMLTSPSQSAALHARKLLLAAAQPDQHPVDEM